MWYIKWQRSTRYFWLKSKRPQKWGGEQVEFNTRKQTRENCLETYIGYIELTQLIMFLVSPNVAKCIQSIFFHVSHLTKFSIPWKFKVINKATRHFILRSSNCHVKLIILMITMTFTSLRTWFKNTSN